MPRDERINPIMHGSQLCDICTGEKKCWGANGQHEVSGYAAGVGHANKSTSAVSWDTVDMERPVKDPQVARHRVQFVLPFEDNSPQGIHNLQRHLPPPHLFYLPLCTSPLFSAYLALFFPLTFALWGLHVWWIVFLQFGDTIRGGKPWIFNSSCS